jgi:hypothetical protein
MPGSAFRPRNAPTPTCANCSDRPTAAHDPIPSSRSQAISAAPVDDCRMTARSGFPDGYSPFVVACTAGHARGWCGAMRNGSTQHVARSLLGRRRRILRWRSSCSAARNSAQPSGSVCRRPRARRPSRTRVRYLTRSRLLYFAGSRSARTRPGRGILALAQHYPRLTRSCLEQVATAPHVPACTRARPRLPLVPCCSPQWPSCCGPVV